MVMTRRGRSAHSRVHWTLTWRTVPEHARPHVAALARGAEEDLRLVAVVGSAAELDVLDRRRPGGHPRDDVVELQVPTHRAALAVATDERAASPVARFDGPLHVRGDVA